MRLEGPRALFDLTHVLCEYPQTPKRDTEMKLTAPKTDDDASLFSLAFALIRLSRDFTHGQFLRTSIQGLRTEKDM